MIRNIDLHRHLEGSVRPETIFELLPQGERLTIEELRSQMIVDGTEKDLMDFIGKLGTRFMKMVTKGPDEVIRFAYEACEDAYLDGVNHLEMRVSPTPHSKPNFSTQEVLEACSSGFDLARREFGMSGGIIVSLKRDDPMELNESIIQKSMDLYRKGRIIGFDLSSDEKNYPGDLFIDMFAKIDAPKTIHAGEAGPVENIAHAIASGATRIGHGTKILESDKIINLVIKKNILIEVCISSNLATKSIDKVEDHPVFKFDDLGIRYILCTDDPVTQGTKLSDEYRLKDQNSFSVEDYKFI